MKDEPKTIDVEAEVVTVIPLDGSIGNPIRAALATVSRGQNETQLFAPAEQPTMRGRRPSGVVFQDSTVPKESRGVPIEEPPDFKVPKRSAKSTAEELTGCSVVARDRDDGRCSLEVIWSSSQRQEFTGNTWWLALCDLKYHLDRRAKKK